MTYQQCRRVASGHRVDSPVRCELDFQLLRCGWATGLLYLGTIDGTTIFKCIAAFNLKEIKEERTAIECASDFCVKSHV